ncbi:secretion protein HlyD family protein [Solidesulfovibrio carbinoliphilus subsp. oakridgensis]|uniref:Secretion protein HlyD family protein n=1 Tax=Solidesulfovibrio carbinoliphilus subsp. oakridgensis TaxID=694327 RepID=G7Q8L6_9BACT|nr:HlyD family secretion protein [Solidesulfovibrio carbinoliphilus]EHJ49103.1 secretion protein HlyD family protein [Solidesulfovibrio carbinoliphilus subsp. oakridgensis]
MKPFFRPKHKPEGASSKKKQAAILVAAVLALAGFGYYLYTRSLISTDDAFVDGRVHPITPRVAGYVNAVPVEDNQLVAAGDVLVVLDPTDNAVALAQAKADLASAEAQLAAQELGVPLQLSQTSSKVTAAKAQLESEQRSFDQAVKERDAAVQEADQIQTQLDQDKLDYTRISQLRGKGVVSQSDLDTIENKRRGHEAQLRAARAKAEGAGRRLESITADIKRLRSEITLAETGQDQAVIQDKEAAAQRARVELAREKVRQAELNLTYTRILAPVAGHVTKKQIESGRLVAAGQSLMTLVPLTASELWVTANYKETQLKNVQPGQRVTMEVDTYPGRDITGRVESIMAGTGSVFSLFPTENASGNYVKIVQRIPVKIVFDKENGDLPNLRLGMSVVPTIHTD